MYAFIRSKSVFVGSTTREEVLVGGAEFSHSHADYRSAFDCCSLLFVDDEELFAHHLGRRSEDADAGQRAQDMQPLARLLSHSEGGRRLARRGIRNCALWCELFWAYPLKSSFI